MTARTPVHGDDTCTIQADMPTMLPRYYRARYIDSITTRFLSEDPVGFGGGLNFYTYVGNSPVNLSDPFGLCSPDDKKKECPVVPEFPAGVNLLDNIKEAERSRWLILAQLRLLWFYEQVRNHGPWDYKQIRILNDFGSLSSPYQDFGNFNFGMTGAAAGIELQVLLRGAGWAQRRAGTSQDDWG